MRRSLSIEIFWINFRGGGERNIPHIMMDLDFSMPSRTRALLYEENCDQVTEAMCNSYKRLLPYCDYIVCVCGTAHYFLKDVYQRIPEAQERTLDIIDITARHLAAQALRDISVVAAEGALKKKLYDAYMECYGIVCYSPDEDNWDEIRFFIEAVKRNQVSDEVLDRFIGFVTTQESKNIILGCTELPILYERLKGNKSIESIRFFDPMELVLHTIANLWESRK